MPQDWESLPAPQLSSCNSSKENIPTDVAAVSTCARVYSTLETLEQAVMLSK